MSDSIVQKMEIIAGPCSAESREQLLECAKALHEIGITHFRSGVWKPRTHPGTFEGVGDIALEWLDEVQQLYGMNIAIEVAKSEHITKALKHNIHTLWLGSRTTSNPFAVQEIADAINKIEQKEQLTILIKNPITPDIELWSGALERIARAGVKDIKLIHRGFTSYERSIYRNAPLWSVATQMKQRHKEIPMICDPSHIGGRQEYVAQIAQQAIDLHFDGLMIEVHNNPEEALSDSMQQLTPQQFREIISSIQIRDSKELPHNISLLREEIDQIDNKIISLLKERNEITKQIGNYKRINNIPLYQEQRHKMMIESRRLTAKEKGINSEFIESIMELIHSQSLEEQLKNK